MDVTKHFFDGISLAESVPQPRLRESESSRPLSLAEGFSIAGGVDISASVLILRETIRPYAIFWAVICITVFSLYGHAFRPKPHVFKEVLKLHPSIAHTNPFTPVCLPRFRVGVTASGFHCVPHPIHRVFTHVVFCESLNAGFPHPTPTGSGPLSERASNHVLGVSAVTLTLPQYFVSDVSVWGHSDYEKISVPEAGSINDFSHLMMVTPQLRITSGFKRQAGVKSFY